MIRDGIRAVRLFRSESRADTVVAVALAFGVAVTLIESQR